MSIFGNLFKRHEHCWHTIRDPGYGREEELVSGPITGHGSYISDPNNKVWREVECGVGKYKKKGHIMINKNIAIFTVIEDLALVAWLTLVRAGQQVLGVLVLPVGFFVEHVIAYNTKREAPLLSLDTTFRGKLFVNAVVETVIWVVWLALWPIYTGSLFGVGLPLLASVFLFLALIVEHSLTDNIFHGRPLTENLFNKKVVGFSFVEFLGATAWLGLIGAGLPFLGVVALVVAQYIEHQQALALANK